MLFDKMAKGVPLTMITCYDYPMAYLVEQAGIDIVLVGDSLGMTILGYDSTLPVTMDDMIRHAAGRAPRHAQRLADRRHALHELPAVGRDRRCCNAGRFMAEAACDGIKLEGGQEVVLARQGDRRRRHPGDGPPGPDAAERVQPGRLPPAGQERQAGQEDRGRRAGARRGRRDGDPARAGARPGLRADHRARRASRSSAWAAARTPTASC